MTNEPIFLLRGVAGSTSHGLATENSDQDLHGVFGYPTPAFWHLNQPEDSLVGHEPQDYSYHELGKYLKLALKSNPTVLELLWLDEYIEKDRSFGDKLIKNRQKFLSADHVRNAYMGYATAQFGKIFRRDGEKPNRKNVRHMFRLMEAGYDLYTTGNMSVKVRDRDWYFWVEQQDITLWTELFQEKRDEFMEAETVLPDEPDRQFADDFLFSFRDYYAL